MQKTSKNHEIFQGFEVLRRPHVSGITVSNSWKRVIFRPHLALASTRASWEKIRDPVWDVSSMGKGDIYRISWGIDLYLTVFNHCLMGIQGDIMGYRYGIDPLFKNTPFHLSGRRNIAKDCLQLE